MVESIENQMLSKSDGNEGENLQFKPDKAEAQRECYSWIA